MIRRAAPRRGFTLVEILVVIGIIAILASLITVVAIKGLSSAKRTQASADIAQISSAIGTFKAKMNAGYIPAGGWGPKGGFRLCTSYLDASNNPLPWPEVVYLKQLFPQMVLADNGLRIGGAKVANGVAAAQPGDVPLLELDANQTLVLFLTGGPPTNFQGFSTNRAQPFETTATNRLGPFLDFPATRYATGTTAVSLFHASDRAETNANGAASLMDPWGGPFAYFTHNTTTNNYMTNPFVYRGTTVNPYVQGGRPLNQKSFQIVSAGENGPDDTAPFGFGSGGNWVPGAGDYTEGGPGFDDVANFHEGQLGAK